MNFAIWLLAGIVFLKLLNFIIPQGAYMLYLLSWPFVIFLGITIAVDIFEHINKTVPQCPEGDYYCEVRKRVDNTYLTDLIGSVLIRTLIVILTFIWFING